MRVQKIHPGKGGGAPRAESDKETAIKEKFEFLYFKLNTTELQLLLFRFLKKLKLQLLNLLSNLV